MKFKNEEISDVTGVEFQTYFKNKYPSFQIISLNFGVEFYFNQDEVLGKTNIEKICHINCSSSFSESDDFSMDFRGFSGNSFKECFEKFKAYYEGMYNVYLLDRKSSDED